MMRSSGETRTAPSFSSRLRELRMLRGLRQKDLAAALGLGQTTIANYEKNLRFPDEKTLLKTADFFGTSLDYLLGRAEARSSAPERADAGDSQRPLGSLGRRYLSMLLGAKRMCTLK